MLCLAEHSIKLFELLHLPLTLDTISVDNFTYLLNSSSWRTFGAVPVDSSSLLVKSSKSRSISLLMRASDFGNCFSIVFLSCKSFWLGVEMVFVWYWVKS